VKELEDALKGEDKDVILAKTETLMTVSQKLGEKMYADMQAKEATAAAGAGAQDAKPADDNVVDAEVKEVKKG
jgi:molecular chaperone DnaK